ncbi:MAG: GNAT family N-acetyltransferase [Burkholderiales bacterium]|nr:GNAT family N-acetyltransferase [Nitrosomonadaceae bacterium]
MHVSMVTQATSRDVADLCALLHDAVEHGASVGYVKPIDNADVSAYWQGVLAEVAGGAISLLVLREGERIVGTVQLAYAMKPNSRHRAEVQKMLVHSAHRRKGYGRVLMQAVEDTARRAGRSVLVLDTETDSAGQKLYAAVGWVAAGVIPKFALATSGEGQVATTYMYKLLDA